MNQHFRKIISSLALKQAQLYKIALCSRQQINTYYTLHETLTQRILYVYQM